MLYLLSPDTRVPDSEKVVLLMSEVSIRIGHQFTVEALQIRRPLPSTHGRVEPIHDLEEPLVLLVGESDPDAELGLPHEEGGG